MLAIDYNYSMLKTLIIAEKPSVAKDIANALGVPRSGNIYENSELVVSNCRGHLIKTTAPGDDDFSVLPLIPEKFSLKVIKGCESQFSTVRELMLRSDIGGVVNACDAGREGELIFRLSYEHAACKKSTERMWLQTMTQTGILKAWKERVPGSNYDGLSDAAKSRNDSDWLFGKNGSRAAFSTVGRVVSPTLAMVVRSYLANKGFTSSEYYEVHGTFKLLSGEYTAKWLPNGATASENDDQESETSRFSEIGRAQLIVDKCLGQIPSSVADTSKTVKSAPPSLFDLTTLQREANRLFKFSAAKTLTIAQSLYEKHKVTSYPRTDSSHLPEDYLEKCIQIVTLLGANISALKPHTDRLIQNNLIHQTKRIFNNAKISDHFAIIPTDTFSASMDADEQAIYGLICKRFLAAFHPDAEFLQTIRTTIVVGERFLAGGKILVKAGWREVYGSFGSDPSDKDPTLPILTNGEIAKPVTVIVKTCKTKAPPLLTEATLLRAMETAGKSVDDQDVADALKGRGIGTPATRAATIEKLKEAKNSKGEPKTPFITVEKNFLIPTEKGLGIIAYLNQVYPAFTSATLTGEWEMRLSLIEDGTISRVTFMEDVRKATLAMVDKFKASPPVRTPSNRKTQAPEGAKKIGSCPFCPSEVFDNGPKYSCSCGFAVWKVIAKKKLLVKDIKDILSKGKTEKIEGFTSKAGKTFGAFLIADKEKLGVTFKF